jgi:hypothetical protein
VDYKNRNMIGRLGVAALVAVLGVGCGSELLDDSEDGVETGGTVSPPQQGASPTAGAPGDAQPSASADPPTGEAVDQIQSALTAPSCIRVVGHSYDFWRNLNKYFVKNDCSRWYYVSVDLGGLWSNTACNFVLPREITMFTKSAPWKIRYVGVEYCGT